MKTYIINLKESYERRKYMLKEVANYSFMEVELVEAVNGRKLTRQETDERFNSLKFACRYKRMPQPGEIGCTLSHYLCYQKMLDSKEEVALILEDDVSFVSPDVVEPVITRSARLISGKGAGMVFFTHEDIYHIEGETVIGDYKIHKLYHGVGTWAYLVNRKAAERMLRTKRPSIVADEYVFMRRKGINIRCVCPRITAGLSSKELVPREIEKERTCKNTYKPKGWMRIPTLYYHMYYLFLGWKRRVRFKLGELKKSDQESYIKL